ncbi:hypothetical protein CDD81_4098 [Ophiocordyceps australis]|uniref:AAA+ ATPase domain-containing protein n=1 Tax=Ophiocordyceps australis TaxID=1399860 RepID=A0A2C5Y7H1_9HYPO|nr:hypothetical protein CDD81_4098 [Ophiocordyceps australis]
MGSKRKRNFEDFDPNKSDSDDENFDPSVERPRKSSKTAKSSRRASARTPRVGRKRGNHYEGSDIDDDEDDLLSSDSQNGSFMGDDEEDEANAPINAAGRRTRRAAINRSNYRESSDDEDADLDHKIDDKDELGRADQVEIQPDKPAQRKLVKIKVPQAAKMPTTRRSTRASTAETDDFIELSHSGRAVASRKSKSKSPEVFTRTRRSSRAMKGLKSASIAIETIEEATQESSLHDADQSDELSQEEQKPVVHVPAAEDQDMKDVAADEQPAGNDDEDDDDVPVQRRTRSSRANASAPEPVESDVADKESSGRLTRGSRLKKSTQEPSSDFDPGEESDEAEMSGSDSAKDKGPATDVDSPAPRGRSNRRKARSSRRAEDSGDEEPDFDLEELNEEARELRQCSRPRRRPRQASPIVYQEHTRRSRAKVNYYMPPLTSMNMEDDEAEDPAPTPSRNRRGKAGGGGGWDRNLNTTLGPFGGGGNSGSLLGGPWGTLAAGGADSDSSDDEMVHRSTVAGNVGMTPTSAAPGGLLGGGQGFNIDGVGATPNVGKIKDRKALADADPLGVDLNVDFSKVGGLQGHIDQLKEMVQLPLLYPELFTKFHVTPPRGVLFHGPPGTGKTLLARALANSVGSGGKKISFYMRKGADALSKWVGEAEKQLRLLFEEARKNQPSIIFFDEIDGLAPVRSSKQEQIHASIVSTLLALMDGMDGRGQVIVIGATNRPDNIDPALRRPGRFDREFYFPLPDIEGRRAILDIHTKDWGLSDSFKASLADKTKGYGGADLRALCTEAALNSIQRTYPQIYSSGEKLVVDPDQIQIHASDFMISIKKMIPSSERSATSGAQPLPAPIEPLLRDKLSDAKKALDNLLPRKKNLTALEEAMFEQYNDNDHGFGREVLQQEFDRSRVYRPRLILYGAPGMGQGYISSAVLHYFEGIHVQNFDLPSLLADGRPMEQVIVGLFTEVRRHKPSVIYIPNIDAWYAALDSTVALVTFQSMLKSIAPTEPVLLLATAECDDGQLPSGIVKDFFGFTHRNRLKLDRPAEANRKEYFGTTLEYVKKRPTDFPDPENRKKRRLEELPVAPAKEPKPPTKAEKKALQKRDHQLLNGLKIQLQPIMDQINRRYKKFRQPVIPQAQIDYLFIESDPNFVRPDIPGADVRPFEIVKDKHGNDVLKETATGKFYYNLETTTIEERLSNGFYARPKDFLFDIKALAKDARNIGDKERTLKANELLSNVEVDVASIETSTAHIDWEGLYQRQLQRAKEAAEKERKRRIMQSITDRFQSDQGGGNDSDAQGPLTLGETVPGSRTTARFQLCSPPLHSQGDKDQDFEHGLSNGTPCKVRGNIDLDTVMSGTNEAGGAPIVMGPPPAIDGQSLTPKDQASMAQISQRSAVTALPAGVSPSAVLNEASTTKTSDPSTRPSSDWSTQRINGQGAVRGPDEPIPDTLCEAKSRRNNVPKSSNEAQVQSQAVAKPMPMSQAAPIARMANSFPPARPKSQVEFGAEVASPKQAEAESEQNQAHGADSVDAALVELLDELTHESRWCSVEQLEQVNREMMDTLWQTRHEWNRLKALGEVRRAFTETLDEMDLAGGGNPYYRAANLASQQRASQT